MPAEHDNSPAGNVFDRDVAEYDSWYDSPKGSILFANELDALEPLLAGAGHPQLEVGAGTGRFAAALGVDYGIDPAGNALDLAANRGIQVTCGTAEELPFADSTFGAVLFVTSLCFVADPQAALAEARRVLTPDGMLVLGVLPLEGAWARHYSDLAEQGNPYYQQARFFSRPQLMTLLETSGFHLVRIRTTLFAEPGKPPVVERARDGDDPRAGFLALQADPNEVPPRDE